MEYASETDATEAAKKYQDVELGGHRLYVIRAMTERMMSFGETVFIITDLCDVFWLVFNWCIFPETAPVLAGPP